MIHSLMCSPELHEFLNEDRIEEIFVKFSAEKKNLKRNELTRKVREKINFLFHFVMPLDESTFREVSQNYPAIANRSFSV